MMLMRVVCTFAVLLGSVSTVAAATATWNANPEPDISHYLLSYGTQSGVHPTVINVGNVTTYQFFPPPGRIYVVVQAVNTSGGVGPKSAEVAVDIPVAPNQPPTLTQPANQASAENAAVSLQLVGSDPQGTPVTYSATGLPQGLSVNATSGLISGTLSFTSAGTHSVTATVSDGSLTFSRTFTWTVTNTNQQPALTQPANQSSTQNTSASLTLVGSDPDGTAVTYSASGLPAGLSVNATSGVISGTITAGPNTYNVTATVSDGSLTANRNFTWTVTAAGGSTTVNLSPQDSTINVNNINASASYRLNAYTLPSNQVGNAIVMKFDLSQIPANATIQSAILNLALIEMDGATGEASYNVSLHQIINRNPDVSRATGLMADATNQWTPNACCRDNYPMAQADILPATTVTAIDRTVGFKTWNATSLVQAWIASPASNYGLLLNPDTSKQSNRYRNFASMENASVADRPYLRVTYSVSGGGDTTPPTVSMTAPANNASVSGASVTLSANASDAGGGVRVQFRVDGANVGAEDTTAPYSIIWNSTSVADGAHVITAVARDAAGNSATSSPVTVTVANTPVNRAPTLTQPANQSTAEGASASLQLVGSDPDGNPLTYSASGLPGGLSVNAASGLISGTPSFTSAGNYTVTATVSDGSLSASRSFTWAVSNTNRPPVLQQPENQSSALNESVSLTLSASDPDGTAVTYSATGLPPGLSVNASTGLISGTISGTGALYNVVATASDGALTASRTFTWGVNNADLGVAGDFDGDGREDLATFRPSTGEWRIWLSSANFTAQPPFTWGTANDVPVAADYDGDGRTDFAVFRPSTGGWHAVLSTTSWQTSLNIVWGESGDRPVPMDYDGDGRADLALARYGGYDILLSSTNYATSVSVR